jgi:hypothetical protein
LEVTVNADKQQTCCFSKPTPSKFHLDQQRKDREKAAAILLGIRLLLQQQDSSN